jgi:tellurite resistance protein TehA-like permease
MATGIVAIAVASQGLRSLGEALFALNLVAFAVLSSLMLRRLIGDRAAVIAELSQHRTAPGFLTIVASLAVLGVQFAAQANRLGIGTGLWLAACGFWVLFGYGFFAVLATRREKPRLADGLDGAWLLVSVATESLAVLGTYVASAFARPELVVYLCLCWFLLGGFFYLIVIALIVYRWLFEPLPPAAFSPSYWINMGAMAIATLAGARLEAIGGASALTKLLLPSVALATVLCWAVASWWIPLLLGLTVWHRLAAEARVPYRAENWSMVFPLGMYTAATWTLVRVDDLGFLSWLPRVFMWIALAAWVANMGGMIRSVIARPQSDDA